MALTVVPDLVLASILSYTDTSNSKSLLAGCKRLRDLTLAHKAVALIVQLPRCATSSSLWQGGREVTSEQMHRLQRVSSQCPTLARLKLVGTEHIRELMDEQLSAVFGSCMAQPSDAAAQTLLVNITHVTLQHMSVTKLLPLHNQWLPNLQHLLLSNVDIRLRVDSHTLPTPTFQHLHTITLDCSSSEHSLLFTAQHIKQQLSSLPSLSSLHINQGYERGIERLYSSSIARCVEVVSSQLTSLTCNDATPTSQLLSTPFPRLQCLTLLVTSVGDAAMELLLTRLPILQQLSVDRFLGLSDDYSGRVCSWSQLEVMRLEVHHLLQLPLASVRQLRVHRQVTAFGQAGPAMQQQLQQIAAAMQVAQACGGLQGPAAPCTSSSSATNQQQGVVHFVVGGGGEVVMATVPFLASFHALQLFAKPLSLDLLKAVGQLPRCTYLSVHSCRYLRSCVEQVDRLIEQMLDCLPHVQVLEGAETLCTEVRQFEAFLKSVTRPITLRFQVDDLNRLYVEDGHEGDGFDERMLDTFIKEHTPHPECIQYIFE